MLSGIVDLHSHFIPGVDDGARTPEEAVRALVAMAAQGCDSCVTTPHIDASLTRNKDALAKRLAAFDRGWDQLGSACARHLEEYPSIPLPMLFRGVELMLDDPEPDLSDAKLRLCGGAYVLCEFPSLQLPTNAYVGIAALSRQGWRPVVAHPERYRNLDANFEALRQMREVGAYFQVNAGSLTGKYGSKAERYVRRLLELGWVSFMASDHHARGTPQISDAVALLAESGGLEQAKRLMAENPRRILIGATPVDIPAIAPQKGSGWWNRLVRLSGGD
jgi:protein-tyrosine phosphatase